MDDHSDFCILKEHIDSHAMTVGVAHRVICQVDAIKEALRDFDNARIANQWPHTGQSRAKDSDEFIDRVRAILRHNESSGGTASRTPPSE